MQTLDLKRQSFRELGTCLEYPHEDNRGAQHNVVDKITKVSRQAGGYLKEFFIQIDAMSFGARQEHYVQTFDLMPQCSLYVSVHLFGEESFKRAELMAGLKRIYDSRETFNMTELPDHLAVILKRSDMFNDEEWYELVTMGILPALLKMIDNLEKRSNPYALILKAVWALLIEKEKAHA